MTPALRALEARLRGLIEQAHHSVGVSKTDLTLVLDALATAREGVAAAPHGFACASYTIVTGKPPTANFDPPQVYRPRQPPDETLCDCWKAKALKDPTGVKP